MIPVNGRDQYRPQTFLYRQNIAKSVCAAKISADLELRTAWLNSSGLRNGFYAWLAWWC